MPQGTGHLDKAAQEESIRRLARDLDRVPEALSELRRAAEVKEALEALGKHRVRLPVRDARPLLATRAASCSCRTGPG